MTSMLEAERRLREERDRAQRYLEVASTLVVVLDAQGRVELINRQGCHLSASRSASCSGVTGWRRSCRRRTG